MDAGPAAFLALLSAIIAVLCGGMDTAVPAVPPPPPAEKVLTLRYWQAPSIPLPYFSGGDKDVDAGAITLEPLASYAPDGTLVPRLAAYIPTLENGGVAADLMSITWRLREGLRWSDGRPLDAGDVKFSFIYCTEIAAEHCVQRSRFAGVEGVYAVGDREVAIVFDAPTPYPYTAFVGAKTPVISRTQFEECDGNRDCVHNFAPLGSGPYRIVNFDFGVDNAAVYERNPYYRGAPADFDRVILRGGGRAGDAARAVLRDGAADFAWNIQIPPEELAALQADSDGRAVAAFGSLVEAIAVNQTNPDSSLGTDRAEYLDGRNPHPFLTFRPIPQAMSLAIDRGDLAESQYGFAGRPACNLVDAPPGYASAANDGCEVQDIAAANRLLEANGVVDGDGDGIREYDGMPLRVSFQTTVNAVRQETQRRIAGWWREIGIDTEIVTHPAADFFGGDPVVAAGASYRRFFADLQMYADGPAVDPQQYLANTLCAEIQSRANGWAAANNTRACAAEYDALYRQLAQTPSGPARQELARRLNDTIVQSYYQIPLVNRARVSAHAGGLRGVRPNAWDSDLWNISDWRRDAAAMAQRPAAPVSARGGSSNDHR